MKRFLIIVVALVVVGGGGLSAFWYANQSEAREQIETALVQLQQNGIETSYDSLDITGFPFAYGGAFENLVARSPGRSVMFEFPEATASMAVSSIGTVDFHLPDEFVFTRLDAAGQATGDSLRVLSKDLVASVAQGEGGYDLGFSAAELSAEPRDGGADRVTFRNLKSDGVFALDQAAERGALDARFSADALTASLSGGGAGAGQNGPVEISASAISGAIVGDMKKLTLNATADSFGVQAGSAADVAITGFDVDLSITPKGEFDQFFEDAVNGQKAAQAITQMAVATILGGGEVDADMSFASLTADFAEPSEGANQTVSLRSENFTYNWDVSPELAGLAIAAGALKMDIRGSETAVYDMDDVELTLKAQSAAGYDYAPLLLGQDPEMAFQMFLDMLRRDIAQGGSAELLFASSRTDSAADLKIPQVPLDRITSKAGPNRTLLRLTGEQAVVSATGEAMSYEVSGMIAGAADIKAFVFEGAFPMKAAADPQNARLIYDIDTITIDDGLWSQFDPQNRLPRDIRGLRLEADMDVIVLQDILEATSEMAAPPVSFNAVHIREVLLDFMGFRGEAVGQVAISPPPPSGEITVTLHNWREFLANFSATPLGQGPQGQTFALMASAWLDEYGAPGEEASSTRLQIDVTESGATINGKPFNPAPQ